MNHGRFAAEVVGKTIESAEYVEEERYWALTFTDGTELCVRLMVDVVNENEPWR